MRWDVQRGNGRYRGRLKTKHGEGFGLPMLGCFRILGRVKTNHEKGFGFFKGSEGFGGNSMRTSTTSCC